MDKIIRIHWIDRKDGTDRTEIIYMKNRIDIIL